MLHKQIALYTPGKHPFPSCCPDAWELCDVAVVDCVARLLVVVLCVVDVDTEVLIVYFVVVMGVDFVVVGVDFVVVLGVDFVVVFGVGVDSVVVLYVVVLWLVVGGESVVV